MAEEGSASDEVAKQIESEVIDDMYKTTVSKLHSRREQYKNFANDDHVDDDLNKDKYRSYLEGLRKEYKNEKEEKIRNKSFEYDKSSRNYHDSSFNGNFTMNNILGGSKEAESGRQEPDFRSKEKETVVVRTEIRNRAGNMLPSMNARSELRQESYGAENLGIADNPFARMGGPTGDHGMNNDRGILELSRDALGKHQIKGQSSFTLRDKEGNELLEEISDLKKPRFRYQGLSNDRKTDEIGAKSEPQEYGGQSTPMDFQDSGTFYPKSKQKYDFMHPSHHERDYLKAATIEETMEFERKAHQSPKDLKREPAATNSSDKKLYTWNDDKLADDSHKQMREKSKDPFEDKSSHRHGLTASKEIALSSSRLEAGRPPIRDRSPQNRSEIYPTRSDRFNGEGKVDAFDRPFYTERDKRDAPPYTGADYSTFPRKETDQNSIVGRSKRIETENQILLLNNAELRRENSELKERLKELDSISELKDKINDLLEKNRKLELQAMRQYSSPLITPKTHASQTQQFFKDYGKEAGSSSRGQSSDIAGHQHKSHKQLPQTERHKLTSELQTDRQSATKLKFADSVLGMIRQLVDLTQGDDEYRQAWKILKNMVGEYVDLKREFKMTMSSPSLQKTGSYNSEHIDFKSTERARLHSEEKNKWRDRHHQSGTRNKVMQ